MSELSHYDETGKIKMVDISDKPESVRHAVATAAVLLSPATIELLQKGANPKGNPLEIARIAGIMAAKKTAELIPLCHQLNLSKVGVELEFSPRGIEITTEARTASQTGVEMEALTAASVAALTIYDMCKAVQKDIAITDIRLLSKTGGKQDFRA